MIDFSELTLCIIFQLTGMAEKLHCFMNFVMHPEFVRNFFFFFSPIRLMDDIYLAWTHPRVSEVR